MKEKVRPTYTPSELKELMIMLDTRPKEQTIAEYIKWLFDKGYRIVKK